MPPADEELVARALADCDTRAYGELVQRYQAQVRGWLRQLARDPALADDIAQDTFIRAWNKLATYSGKGKFSGWLMKIAHNEFLQTLRRQRRHQQPDLRLALQEQPEPVSRFDGELPDVDQFLDTVSDDERAVLVLVHGYGLSHADASDITGMPLGTVKSHARRGRDKIRERFSISTIST